MNTYVFSRFESLQKRLDEIDLILNYASKNENQVELYTSLCRSAEVLLIAHFEGAIKDFTRDVLDDFNRSSFEFKDSPKALKITFCSFFVKKDHDTDFRLRNKLLETFDTLPVKYDAAAFLYKDNKNPNSIIVDNILSRFGVTKFLLQIENSDLDIAFQGSKSSMIEIRNRLKEHLRDNSNTYPYTVDLKLFNISYDKKAENNKKSMWQEFIDGIVKNRHTIAHGNTLENQCSHLEIEESKLKIEILIYAFILVVCKVSLPISS